MLVAILCLIVIVGSTTYAYFKTRIKGDGTDIDVSATTFDINIDESNMTLTSLAPIYDTDKETKANSKTFTVSSNNITSGCINMYLAIDQIGSSLISKYLKYELISNNTVISSGDFSNATNQSTINLIKNSNLSDINNNTYTLRVWISYVEDEDQSNLLTGSDADRTLKLHVKVSGYTGECKYLTLAKQILEDNKTVSERTDFDTTYTENTTGTIFKTNKTEDGSDVYYYAGNTTNNWVKFGKYQSDGIVFGYSTVSSAFVVYSTMEECKSATSFNYNCSYVWKTGDDMYWRIIRTNEDGSVRLLYSGISPNTIMGYIGYETFNDYYMNPMYAGYMYGTSGTLSSNRQNTNDSTIKTYIDKWYEDNLLSNYDKYISKTAIYCNDRSIGSGTYNTDYSDSFYYGAFTRLVTNKIPSYRCGVNAGGNLFETMQAMEDKFSASTTGGGNGQLKYGIALMTADEVAFAGGSSAQLSSPYTWYFTNSEGSSITGTDTSSGNAFWLLSPDCSDNGEIYITDISMAFYGYLSSSRAQDNKFVRPVISLDKCVKVTGSGTASEPYEINENSCN